VRQNRDEAKENIIIIKHYTANTACGIIIIILSIIIVKSPFYNKSDSSNDSKVRFKSRL
jgi:hypothetical protein